ncbi:T9SS outer membrane translocon Sov/SprA [Fulvivirga lutea]|uniref:T9SS outer membrane translocon Sov/SprA n=1 Tax=Fulvivirga lutea TaxID=2810512 RepID=UPI001F2938D0|nr:cell surface protein SprA [Fulvivirga lutea]
MGVFITLVILCALPKTSYSKSKFLFQTVQADSAKKDSVANQPYSPSRRPTYRPKDRFGDPFSSRPSNSPLLLDDPSSMQLDVEIDTGMNYTIYEKIGDLNYRPTSSMSFTEFKQYQERNQLKEYWKNRSSGLDGESAVSGRNLIPPIYISPIFDRIFGGTYVEIIPRGFVTLDFGGRWQRINNPSIPIRQQRNGGFEFDQQISMNIVGKIGEKLQVTANFDNNNSFDFENNLKVEYTGYEEDMLQKLEIGNVSLPLNNSLITGAQNLFGVKAQLQFGDLYVTTVASTQRGKSETITIDGGGVQGRQFELQASNYDENRHFFLSQFFRENYESWLSTIPNINSGVNITRVEVYVVNRNNDTQTTRNILGMMDMGESRQRNIYNDIVQASASTINGNPVRNDGNNMFTSFLNGLNRNAATVNENLDMLGFENGTDFEKITTARKLDPNEYSVNRRLGYISLFRKLQNDEALAVSFEYTYQGRNYKVGELSEDYSALSDDDVIFMKLLRPRKINIDDPQGNRIPTWDLMMKNIYSLNATNVSQDGFELRVIYRDDLSGIDNPQLQFGAVASTIPLIRLLGLDKLNPNNDPQPDGNFDFVEDITISTENGLIIFPFLEPFNTPLDNAFLETEDQFREKFVYEELYNQTKIDAELVSNKNKYVITGSFQSGSSNEIVIPGFNIAEGSVRVFAGGSPLQEGVDYTVDYTFGKVNIINEGVLLSGKTLSISYEKADLFNFQSRTLLGTRFDYKLNDDVNFGATLLHLNERPLISRNSVGNEPIRNTKYGFDVNIRKESRFLTKMLDKLPLISTKEPSSVSFSAEFAQLIPGTSNIVDGEGTSYIDDFENSATPFSLSNPNSWRLASYPQTPENKFLGSSSRPQNDFRAKLAWYNIDNLFYRSDSRRPDGISDEELENHYVRAVEQQEIFANRDLNIINFQQVFDLAFYPNERGQYNYNPNLDNQGNLNFDPRRSWGGITNAIRSEVDFDRANVEYIEFWLMDPFIQSARGVVDDGRPNPTPNTTGGDLFFNLGSISEDVIPDGRHAFENGLPPDGDKSGGDVFLDPDWGYVTTQPFLTNAFDNSESSRANQDVGLDGANTTEENQIFSDFVNAVPGGARVIVEQDPSADNFSYFLSGELDARDATLLERYKNFNGMENNSPVVTGNTSFTPSGTTIPDNEDLNADNTLSELEEYYEYQVPIRPASGGGIEQNEFIVDQITNNINGDEVTWYLYRIPIRQFDRSVGNINGFKSIRYLRTYLTNFAEPVVLRMVNFRFVSSRWRRYLNTLEQANLDIINDSDDIDNFTVSVVNIEENGAGTSTQSPYVLPPGFDRDQDNTSTLNIRLNEQSLQVCVDDLEDGDARAVTKQVQLDLINYGQIKMFLHADSEASDNELTAFLRLGDDVDSNYYEIEVPLKITPQGSFDPNEIWPKENEIDIALDQLYALKSERDRLNISKRALFPLEGPKVVGNNQIRLRGNPDLSSAKWLSIGVRNPATPDGRPLSACIWANELRVSDFDRTKGWAANATLNTKLADFANVTATLQHTTFGFGGIQSRIAERTREETTAYDVSANVNVDKLLPEKLGLQIPMYVSYEKTTQTPRFDPANPDIRLDAALLSFETEEEREEYKKTVQDITTRRSINFTNVKKVKTKENPKNHIWDIENFAFTYGYSETERTNFNLQQYTKRNYDATVAWNFSPNVEPFEPFSNSTALDKKYLKPIKDFNFNPVPTKLGFRADLRREIIQTVYRNNEGNGETENFQKYFTLDRTYNAGWSLTQNLTVDYNARANAIIDEPEGEINTAEEKDSIRTNLENFGRMKNFDQTLNANYKLPLDKLPVTDWVSAEYRYGASYSWRAGPFYADEGQRDSLDFGNVIQNSRDNSITGKLDLVKLYNKINYLKNINSPPTSRRRSSLNNNPKAKDETPEGNKGVNSFLRFLMSVRSINATVALREGTIIPGFTKRAYLFGLDSSFNQPGVPFLLGSQKSSIRYKLAEGGYITTNPNLTAPFTQSKSLDINVRADVSISPSINIQLNAKKLTSASYEEIYRNTQEDQSLEPVFESLSPSRSGSYAVSFLTIGTAFTRDNSDNSSPVFEEFERNRLEIIDRFEQKTGVRYDTNSQDVLIPAFIAAYTGKGAGDVSLSPFPKNPIPNWRIDYTGLNKIPAIQEKFQSITLNHSYQSNYNVVNYSNSLEYNNNLELGNDVESYNKSRFAEVRNGELVPVYVISQVMISEQFAPLIGVNIRTKSRLTGKVEYRTKRDLALNISNAQITEQKSNDIVLELGFTKAGMKMPWKAQGRVVTLKNDLTFRFNFTIRNSKTIQRRIDENDILTDGNLNIQIRPNISYVLNEKLNLQFYFERNITEPKISNAFPRATTRVGFQVRFSLAQ